MYLQLNYASSNVKVDSLTFISLQENYQTAEIYFYSNHVLLYRHKCFTGKYTTRKIHKNYIRDPSGLFSIISHVSLRNLGDFPLLLFLSMSFCLYNKKEHYTAV